MDERVKFIARLLNGETMSGLCEEFGVTGQTVGIKQVDDRLWLATFMHYDLGYFDDETCRLEPIANPFGAKVLPCLRNKPSPMCPGRTIWMLVAEEGFEPPTKGL
jgi:hypothetical protein